MVDLLSQVAKWAARYEWLREHPAWETELFLSGLTPEQFDRAVDRAMDAEKLYQESDE